MTREPTARAPLFVVALAAAALAASACGNSRPEPPRCAECGMRVSGSPRWNAGLTDRGGLEKLFDTPRCLFRFTISPAGRGARGAWVRDYYGQRRIDAAGAFFVAGSDVLGPMGHDLVPIADRPAAERFRSEHHGRAVLAFGDIDRRVLAALDQ